MRIRVILFVATIALALSPGVGAGADVGQSDSTYKHAFPRSQYFQSLGTGIAGTVTDLELYLEKASLGAGVGVTLNRFSDSNYDSGGAEAQTSIGCYTLTTAKVLYDSGDSTCGTDLPLLLDPSKYYLILISKIGGSTDQTYLYGADSDLYAAGESRRNGGSQLGYTDFATALNTSFNGSQGDLFFDLIGAALGVPNEITVPVDTGTITEVPFQPQGSCDQAEEPFLRVVITHADLGFIEERQVVCLADSWAAPDMGTGLWNDDYIITLYADNYVELAFDEHDFTVDMDGNAIVPPPDDAVICSGVSNLFLEGLCDVMVWLFRPDSKTLKQFDGLWSTVSEKPPIGYLTAVLTEWEGLDQGSSSEALEGTVELSDYFDPVKVVMGVILWMLFAMYLVKRVSTINI